MVITPTQAAIVLPGPPVPRSRGLHVSGIIRSIAATIGQLKAEWVDDPDYMGDSNITDPTSILRIAIGLAWEDWYISKVLLAQGVVKHPGEMTVNGVHMTPDGESVDVIITPRGQVPALIIHEVKATYKSIKTVGDLTQQWLWHTQGKSYCRGAKTNWVKYHVLLLNGDYTYPLKPMLMTYLVNYTDDEVRDNWEMLMEYKQWREE